MASLLLTGSKDNLKYKTFITQEMLKSNILASNVIYICVKHDLKKFDQYFNRLDQIFNKIAECEDGNSIDKLLSQYVIQHFKD